MGQGGRQHVVPELLSGYQAWAQESARFSDSDIQSLTTRLQTPGQHGNALTDGELQRLNGFLRSDQGRVFVDGLDQQQIAYKWEHVGQPLANIAWLQDLRRTDPSEAAEIVAMAAKRFNQGETRGRELIQHLEGQQMTSTELHDWIDTVSARAPTNRQALLSGRDNALAAVRLVNELELGEGRLARAWREELHSNGNVGLTRDFSGNPNVETFDAMMRDPAKGVRIFAAIDGRTQAQATVINGANATAQLEMARVELSRQGALTVTSPEGVNYQMTAEGWNRNGVPMQAGAPRPLPDQDMTDHVERGPRFPRAPEQHSQLDGRASPTDREAPSEPGEPPRNLPERGNVPDQPSAAQDHADGIPARRMDQMSRRDRDTFDLAYAAVQARGGFGDTEARNIAAAGLLAMKESRSVGEAQDIGVYGDRLRISSFPYGRDREPNFNVDVTLSQAAKIPEQQSLQKAEQVVLQQSQVRQQELQVSQGQLQSGPTIGARSLS